MAFKESLDKDIRDTFLNGLEFAEEHEINGEMVKCVLDEERYQLKQSKRVNSLDNDGTYVDGLTIFIEESFFTYRPHAREVITLDGEDYYVLSCKKDMGVLEIDVIRYDEV